MTLTVKKNYDKGFFNDFTFDNGDGDGVVDSDGGGGRAGDGGNGRGDNGSNR